MRRLILLSLAAATAAASLLAAPASADVECYGVIAGDYGAGVCAGIECTDLCGPRLVVRPYCYGPDFRCQFGS